MHKNISKCTFIVFSQVFPVLSRIGLMCFENVDDMPSLLTQLTHRSNV